MLGLVHKMISVMLSGSRRAQQFFDPQLVGPDALDGIDGTLKHVIATPELAGALDGHHIAGLFHHAHQGRFATVVATDLAQLTFGHVEAATAE